MRCLPVVALLSLAGAVPSMGQETEPAVAPDVSVEAAEPARPAAAETSVPAAPTATTKEHDKEMPRRASPFASAVFDPDFGPGVGAGVSLPLGHRRLRLAAGGTLLLPGPGRVMDYDGQDLVIYTYAGVFIESRARTKLRPYGGLILAVRNHKSYSWHKDARLQFVAGALLGRGRKAPFVEVAGGGLRLSAGLRF